LSEKRVLIFVQASAYVGSFQGRGERGAAQDVAQHMNFAKGSLAQISSDVGMRDQRPIGAWYLPRRMRPLPQCSELRFI